MSLSIVLPQVLYGPGGAVWWQSGTSGKGQAPYKLVMQNDGNLVLFGNNAVTWQTSSAPAPVPVGSKCGGNCPKYDLLFWSEF